MKRMKLIAVIVVALIIGLVAGGCAASASADQTRPLKIWKHNENGGYTTMCIVDESTGVNYVVVSRDEYQKGFSVAITPRLNADGSLYVS